MRPRRLPVLRSLYSRHQGCRHLEPCELQHVLWSLGHTEDLEDDGESAAATEVARENYPGWRRAA